MAGIHAEEVNRLKAGLLRSYHRTVHSPTLKIGPISLGRQPRYLDLTSSLPLGADYNRPVSKC